MSEIFGGNGWGKKKRKRNHQRDFNVIIDLGKESVHDLYCDDPRAKAPTTNTKAQQQQQQQQRKEAQSEEETENEEAPRADATSLPNLFPYNENPTHYKRPSEPSRTTAHDISSTNQRLSSKNARLSQTQTFSPYNESPKRIYRKSSKFFRRRHTMFHPVIQLLSSTKALPRSHNNNAKESPTSLHICNNSTEW